MRSLCKCLLTIIVFAISTFVFTSQAQQPTQPPQNDPIAKLLELAAPLPDSAYDYEDPWERENPPPIPDEDAPIELLVKYWSRPASSPERSLPNDKIRQRLLDAAEQDSEILPKLIGLMPDTPEAHNRIKAILDARPKLNVEWGIGTISGIRREDTDELFWQWPVRDWLMKRSQHFRDELFAEASKMLQTKANAIGSSGVVTVDIEGALESLIQLDWEKAKPLLDKQAASDSPHLVAKSLGLQFKHAVETAEASQQAVLLERLLQIANDKEAAESARREARNALLKTDWPGRDQYYLSLFNDEELSEIIDIGASDVPLAAPLYENPDKWIPVVAQLIGNPNRKIHDTAINVLMRGSGRPPRKEALLPLLPWLTDPNWGPAKLKYDREGLVQRLANVQIPEAIPYLIEVLEGNERDLKIFAARVFENYPVPQAGPALRKAGPKAAPAWRSSFSRALIRCGALNDAEKLAYLELYASKVDRVDDKELGYGFIGGDFGSFDWMIGSDLSEDKNAPHYLASALIERVKALQPTNPTLADNLLLIVQRWPAPAAFQNITERIGNGTADHRAIGQALRHRDKFRASAGLELQALTKRGGRAAGIAAALLGDQDSEKEILRGQDREAQTALLACARLLREALPVEAVGALYAVKDNSLLRKAVDLYLESEDSAGARKLILAAHPNEALILGAQRSFDPRPLGPAFNWEERLRLEVKRPNGSEEIFGMAFGITARRTVSIRVRRGKAIVIKSKDDSREEFRELTDDEFAQIRELFDATDFDNLPPLIQVPASNNFTRPTNNNVSFASRASTETFQFVHLLANGGRRVYAQLTLPIRKETNTYQKLYALFSRLEKSEGFRLRYKLADKIEGLEVQLADEDKSVKTVCQQGSEIRVLIGNKFETNGKQWFTVSANGLGGETEEPEACQVLGAQKELDKQIGGAGDSNRGAWRVRAGADTIQSGYLAGDPNYAEGLWKVRAGKAPERISDIRLQWLLVAGRRWVLGSQTGENHLQTLRRFDLRTNRLLNTAVPAADYVQPIAEIPETGKVLIACYETNYLQPSKTDFYLLDPATGAAQPVKGEFRPLQQQSFRPLQSVAGSTKFWAAIPDEKLNRTQIGMYDAQRFEFKSLADLPEIKFDSMHMWVMDFAGESARKVIFAYNGHLLSLPFSAP